MTSLRDSLARRFEQGDHPLTQTGASREDHEGLEVTRLSFRTRAGEPVRGLFCRPAGASGPLPAVLNIHAHGNQYGIGCLELLRGRPALQGPMGPALAASGIQSLCLDMPCFGARASVGESAAAKAALWQGRSLAGQMLGECHAALDWLAVQPLVRADRIGVFGISMGATLGYWLAAVDPRVAALAQECCFADFASLIDSGAHDLHGIYLTIPGLLDLADNGSIAGLVAPRPQFIGIGDLDPLTPPGAVDMALATTRAAYDSLGGSLILHREPASGHSETPAMRAAVLEFFSRHLC